MSKAQLIGATGSASRFVERPSPVGQGARGIGSLEGLVTGGRVVNTCPPCRPPVRVKTSGLIELLIGLLDGYWAIEPISSHPPCLESRFTRPSSNVVPIILEDVSRTLDP